MAYAGVNGDNETNIGASKSLSLSFYDSNNTEIAVNYTEENEAMEFYITRNVSDELTLFKEYNTSVIKSLMQSANDLTLFYNVFNLSGTHASIHVQIRPKNVTQYLVFLKYGGLPQLNTRKIDFDAWELFCENGNFIKLTFN